MSDLDPKTIEQLEKLAAAAAANVAALDANSKSQKTQARIELEHQQALQRLTKELIKSGLATKDEAYARALKLKADEDNLEATKKKTEADEEASRKTVDTVRKFAAGVGDFAKSTLAASQSIYNSNKSFTAVLPTLQLVSDTVSLVIESTGKALSGVGISVAGFGFNTGKASEAIAGFVDAGAKLAFAQARIQIENSQKFVDTYQEISKAGMAFGGNIENMRQTALLGGLALDSFQRYVVASSQQLILLGGNMQTGAERALKFGTTIAQNNPKLLAMYGSFDALQSATTDYMALQAQYGRDTNNMTREEIAGARDYLINMKELSAITGKNADALKKEQDERNRVSAYQDAMASKSANDRINTERALEVIRKTKGEEAYKYAMEIVATNGQVTSQTGLQFEGMLGETAQTVQSILTSTDQDVNAYKAQEAQILKDRLPYEQRQMDQYKGYAQLYGAIGNDPLYGIINNTRSAFNRNITAVNDMTYAQQQATADINKPMTDATGAFVQTLKDLELYKIRMDAVTEGQLGRVGKIVEKLYTLQTQLDKMFGTDTALGKALEAFTTGLINAADYLTKFKDPNNKGNDGRTSDERKAGRLNKNKQPFPSDNMVEDLSSLNITPEAKQKTPAITSGLLNVLNSTALKGRQITSLVRDTNPVTGEQDTGAHSIGKAADIRINDLTNEAAVKLLNDILSTEGVRFAQIETGGDKKKLAELREAFKAINGDPGKIVAGGNGLHMHVEAMNTGGKLAPGETALVGENGPEIIQGPGSVTSTAATSRTFDNMLDKLTEMVSILKDHRDISKDLLTVTS